MQRLHGQYPIQSVEISTIAHATEDLEKVQAALYSILPASLHGRSIFSRQRLNGHHGNQIVTFDAKLSQREDITEFSNHLVRQIPRKERLLISKNLVLHSDVDGNLYIRIRKQQAYRGIFEISEDDPIRIRIKFNKLVGKAEKLMKEFLENE